ncbi:MAG: hypothetical protein NW224_28040 [Leptolyngbyaceae cyanobacterium bins.302]|nr:hypothetical protein [Leptolyngbyaceae cyanobacterium bins.302]
MPTAFQQILAELHQLHAHIQLRLPASRLAVQQQLHHLEQVQQQLVILQIELIERSGLGITASTYLTYLTLTQLIQSLIRDVGSLKHLAEEYPIDPEGATACLRAMQKHSDNLLARLNLSNDTHKQCSTNLPRKSSPLHKTEPVLVRQRCEL